MKQRFPEMVEKTQKGDLPLPAVFMDGEVVTTGYVDYLSIARAVQKARSAQAAQPQVNP